VGRCYCFIGHRAGQPALEIRFVDMLHAFPQRIQHLIRPQHGPPCGA
jgi:hypothetical protein